MTASIRPSLASDRHRLALQALSSFIAMGQEACGYPGNMNAIAIAAQRLRLDRAGRGGMTAVHLAAFHGYADALRLLLQSGCDTNAVCDDGETPLHTACTGGSTVCATLLLDHGEREKEREVCCCVPGVMWWAHDAPTYGTTTT